MKHTQKIKTAIKLLKDIEEEGKHNYFTINKIKYFVKKNTLYTNENFDTPVGSIKNGIILFKSKSRKTAMTASKRKMKSSKMSNPFESFEPSTFEPTTFETFEPSFKPVIDSESMESNSNNMNKNSNKSLNKLSNSNNMTNKNMMNKRLNMVNNTMSNKNMTNNSTNMTNSLPFDENVPVNMPVNVPVNVPVNMSSNVPTEPEEQFDEHKEL